MNTQIQDIKKFLRIITIILIGSTLLTPLIFSADFFFPYVTSKAFFMRLMILLASLSYVGLFLFDKNSRPKKSMMLYALTGFIVVLILSTLNSVDPARSMWSNFERMEGLVTMIYMAILFVLSSSVIRKKEWSYIINGSIIISIIVGVRALGGEGRIAGSLGNSSYLGVYALMHIFFALLGAAMIFRGNREFELLSSGEHKSAKKLNTNNYIVISLYLLTVLFNIFILFKTGTRGAFLGLVIGLILSSLYIVWKEKDKIIKYAAMSFLAIVILSVGFLGIFKNFDFIANSNQLSRFASLITTDYKAVLNNQGYARTMIWSMAFEGIKEKPLLGWGQDNFGYVFAKYYDPNMYDQEQWFDRSHNVFMDWLIAAGVLGLAGYLSLFVIALYFLFSKKSGFTVVEKSVWLGLLAAYFVHNLFVFDNLSSYVLFFLILAYINDRYTHDRNEINNNQTFSENEINKFILIGCVSLIIIIFIAYQSVYKPYNQNKKLLNFLGGLQVSGLPNNVSEVFSELLESGSTGKNEVFEQLSTIMPKIIAEESVSTTTKETLLQMHKKIVNKKSKLKNQDARFNYFTSNTYSALGMTDDAILYADRALSLSPKKQTFAYHKAVLLIGMGDLEGALGLIKMAYDNAPQNISAYGYYIGILSDITQKNNYNPDSVNDIANALSDGYLRSNHNLILDKSFWSMFNDQKIKKMIINRLIEILPEEKEKILEASK